jgi:hypothetical protein
MGPAAILAILSVAAPLVADAVQAEATIVESNEKLETTRTLEAYRAGAHGARNRRAIVAAVAEKLPKRAVFLAPALLSARRQWEVDLTVGLIETEMFR